MCCQAAQPDSRGRSFDGRYPREVYAPGVLDADTSIHVPQNALFAGLGDHGPGDHRPAELLGHRIHRPWNVDGCSPFGMVVQVPAVGLVAECGICDRAKDQTVPRLVNCSRWHADDLAAVHRRPATSQPLPQAGLDQFLWLPGACLEHGGRQFEFRHGPVDSFQLASSHRDHPAVCSRFRFLTGESASRHAQTRQRSPAGANTYTNHILRPLNRRRPMGTFRPRLDARTTPLDHGSAKCPAVF